jgi:cyclophilin family peptidyl-prolyl cis-trans isomerase
LTPESTNSQFFEIWRTGAKLHPEKKTNIFGQILADFAKFD